MNCMKMVGCCVVMGALAWGIPAQAQDSAATAVKETVVVGRVKVLLPQTGWQSQPIPVESIKISKGIFGSLEGRAVALNYREGNGPVLATLVIHTTWGTSQSLTMNSNCAAGKDFYVFDYTKGAKKFPECLMVGGLFGRDDVLGSGFFPLMAQAHKDNQLEVPDGGYAVSVNIFRPSAAIVSVEGFLAPQFLGLPGVKPRGVVPEAVPAAVAAWVDALGDGAQNALKIFRDEMPLPPVAF